MGSFRCFTRTTKAIDIISKAICFGLFFAFKNSPKQLSASGSSSISSFFLLIFQRICLDNL